MKKYLLLLPLFSITLFGCNKSNPNLWNRSFKSTGRVVLDYDETISNDSNTSKLTFLRRNYSNIDWSNSGIEVEYTTGPTFTPFIDADHPDLDTFIYNLDHWWDNDVNYHTVKNSIDHTLIIVKHDNGLIGTITLRSDIVPDEPTEHQYIATDVSNNQDGSYITIKLPNKDVTGYVCHSNFRGIVVVRNGPNIYTSVINFTFKLDNPDEGMDTFNLNSYIEIVEHKFKMPWWGTFLIILGSVVLVGVIILIIKEYKRRHHSY